MASRLPEERRAGRARPAKARVTLKAGHQAGHILLQVIRRRPRPRRGEKILRKAREKKSDRRRRAAYRERNLQPDLSPRIFDRRTDHLTVSGRGVGMDVVRKQIQKLRGKIEIHLERGRRARPFCLKAAADPGDHRRAAGGRGRRALHRADLRGAGDAQAGRGMPFRPWRTATRWSWCAARCCR